MSDPDRESKPRVEIFESVLDSLARRSTSKVGDEAVCIATILSMDPTPLFEIYPAHRLSDLLVSLSSVPPRLVFLNIPYHEGLGLRWMLKSLLNRTVKHQHSSQAYGVLEEASPTAVNRPQAALATTRPKIAMSGPSSGLDTLNSRFHPSRETATSSLLSGSIRGLRINNLNGLRFARGIRSPNSVFVRLDIEGRLWVGRLYSPSSEDRGWAQYANRDVSIIFLSGKGDVSNQPAILAYVGAAEPGIMTVARICSVGFTAWEDLSDSTPTPADSDAQGQWLPNHSWLIL